MKLIFVFYYSVQQKLDLVGIIFDVSGVLAPTKYDIRVMCDEGVTNHDTSIEASSRRITRSMSRGKSFIPSPLSLFCITLV